VLAAAGNCGSISLGFGAFCGFEWDQRRLGAEPQ